MLRVLEGGVPKGASGVYVEGDQGGLPKKQQSDS